MQASSLESRIASLVHNQFDTLPRGSKPFTQANGTREWIPMTGIVLVRNENTPHESLKCIAVTTGAKCLSISQVSSSKGLLLHDSHAEVLAIRAFNYWLIRECRSLLEWETQSQYYDQKSNFDDAPISSQKLDCTADDCSTSLFVRRRLTDSKSVLRTGREGPESANAGLAVWPPFELRDEVRVYMYCTCAPCGDASMELCMASQDDPTPWELPAGRTATNGGEEQTAAGEAAPRLLDGRAHFSVLGVVRRKPSRADAEPTLSKSCSDKLALRQITSLLSFPASLLVAPTPSAYLAGLILPEDEISRIGCERAFGDGKNGRLKPFSTRVWANDPGLSYRYRPFTVKSIPTQEVEAQWAFGKPKLGTTPSEQSNQTSMDPKTAQRSKPGNVSAVWISAPSCSPSPSLTHIGEATPNTPASKSPTPSQSATPTANVSESLVNGVKQGYRFTHPNPKKSSVLSRSRMWELLRDTILELQRHSGATMPEIPEDLGGNSPTEKHEDIPYLHQDSPTKTPLDHVLTSPTYKDLKRGFLDADQEAILREKVVQEAKDIMGCWIRNRGDEEWGLDVVKQDRNFMSKQRR